MTEQTQTNAIQSPWLTPPEAARHIKGSKNTLAVMRCKGGGPKFYTRGTRILYRIEDLDAYIMEGRARRKGNPGAGRPPGKGKKVRRSR